MEKIVLQLDMIGACLKDFAPAEPITFAVQMLNEEQQQFNRWNFADFLIGIKYLLAADVESEHPVVSGATYLVVMVHVL